MFKKNLEIAQKIFNNKSNRIVYHKSKPCTKEVGWVSAQGKILMKFAKDKAQKVV